MALAAALDPPDAPRVAGEVLLDRAIRALNHPLRRQILRELVRDRGSATTIARELREDLAVVSYHLNTVLARECRVVELVDTVPRRGALEKFYVLPLEAVTRAGAEAAEPEGFRRVPPEEGTMAAVAAMDASASERLEDSIWEWFLATVDAAGWEEICEARAEFNRRVEAAVEKSQARGEGGRHEVVVGAATFPVAPPTS